MTDAAAVSSRGTQSLFINVRLTAGLYDMLSLLRRVDSNHRSPTLFCHAPNVCEARMTYFQVAGLHHIFRLSPLPIVYSDLSPYLVGFVTALC